MGTNTLSDRTNGQIIDEAFFNDIHSAANGDFVGRNSSGVATSGQALGTATYPWGVFRCGSLVVSGSSVDVSQVAAKPFRLVSGATRSSSNQPALIDPNGAAASFTVDGDVTDLVFDVNGTTYTLSAELTKSSLTAAPSTNNTALVDDALAADQESTRTWGQFGGERDIIIDTVGSEITAVANTLQAFKINDGTTDEYFMAFVDTGSSRLTHCMRGFFYNSSFAPINAVKFANNDTITLMLSHYVFLDSDLTTVDTTTKPPAFDASAPGSPATGDYWYDTANNLWKRYSGSSFDAVNRVLVGIAVMDSSNCVAARSFDFDSTFRPDNSILQTEAFSTSVVQGTNYGAAVNVYGNRIEFGTSLPNWNITTDLASSADMHNASEQASTIYYCYIKDDGAQVISDIAPLWRPDLFGWYHPHNPWRKVSAFYNDSGSDITDAADLHTLRSEIYVHDGNGYGSTNTKIRRWSTTALSVGKAITYTDSSTLGGAFTINEDGFYSIFHGDSASTTVELGLSKNSNQLTTNLDSISSDHFLAIAFVTNNSQAGNCAVAVPLEKGDVIRAHHGGICTGGAGVSTGIRITKINIETRAR